MTTNNRLSTMRLQIGTSDFGEARIKNLTFIDKTLFIKEILDNAGVKVSLSTRPRRSNNINYL